jgi:hypothetical protein
MELKFDGAADLAKAMERAAAAHGKHEEEIGHEDAEWPIWYAQYLEREQAGEGGPAAD